MNGKRFFYLINKDTNMIEIIPAGQSAVISERDRDHHHGSRHPDHWDLSTEMQRDLNHVRDQAEKEFIEITNQAERNSAAAAVQGARTDSKVQGSELNTQKAIDSHFEKSQRQAFSAELNLQKAIDYHYEKTQKQVSDSATATVVGFKDAAATAYQIQGQSLLDSQKNAAAVAIQNQQNTDVLASQATGNFNLSSVQAVSNFNSLTNQANVLQYNILLDSQKNAAAAAAALAACCCELKERIAASEMLAVQNAAAAAAQLAECCCEQKLMFAAQTAFVLADGQKTRDLLNDREVADLREKLTDAKARARRRTYSPVPPGTLIATDDD
jgi:hypothetical protein